MTTALSVLATIAGSNLLTHSRMACAKTCLRKHYFQYELGIRREESAHPLRMGGAIHKGIELRATGHSEADAITQAVAAYEEIPVWCNTDELVYDWAIEREKVARLLSGYFWRWPDAGLKILATEQSFRLPIRNPETDAATNVFELGGKIDMLIELPDGRRAVRETKTTSDDILPDSDYWRRLRIDQQISLYFCAANELGYDVHTVEYDAIRKPTIDPLLIPLLDPDGAKIVLDADGNRVRTKDGKKWRESGDAAQGYTLQSRRQTPEEYGERLTNDIVARPDFYFQRVEIPRLNSDIEEWRQELWDQQQTLRSCQKRDVWYRNTAACIHPYRCEYLDQCHNGIDLAQGIPSGFVRVENLHPELTQE